MLFYLFEKYDTVALVFTGLVAHILFSWAELFKAGLKITQG